MREGGKMILSSEVVTSCYAADATQKRVISCRAFQDRKALMPRESLPAKVRVL